MLTRGTVALLSELMPRKKTLGYKEEAESVNACTSKSQKLRVRLNDQSERGVLQSQDFYLDKDPQ